MSTPYAFNYLAEIVTNLFKILESIGKAFYNPIYEHSELNYDQSV